MFNRKQYLAGECSHNDYYGQFVTEAVLNFVEGRIGLAKILKSKERSFCDIPLKKWDALAPGIENLVGKEISESNASTTVGDVKTISLSDCVCTAKVAARIIRTRNTPA